MSMRRIAALQVGLLLAVVLANASPKNTVRITVLDSVTQASAPDNNGVPQNCEQLTFDAYCRSTTNVPLISTLLVQEDNQPPFRISCTIESKFSRCVPLNRGETFDAKIVKRGVVVYYADDKGKARSQLYTLVAGNAPPATVPVSQPQPAPSTSAGASKPAAPVNSPSQVAPAVAAQEAAPSNIKCSFSSTPSGAEITLDGKFVGSTPSEITVATGKHVVAFSMPGFADWKRELTVVSGSQLTVNAILQKQ